MSESIHRVWADSHQKLGLLLIGPLDSGESCGGNPAFVHQKTRMVLQNLQISQKANLHHTRLISEEKFKLVVGGKNYSLKEFEENRYRLAREIGRKAGADFVYLIDRKMSGFLFERGCLFTHRLIQVNDSKNVYMEVAKLLPRMTTVEKQGISRKARASLFGIKSKTAIRNALRRKNGGLLTAVAQNPKEKANFQNPSISSRSPKGVRILYIGPVNSKEQRCNSRRSPEEMRESEKSRLSQDYNVSFIPIERFLTAIAGNHYAIENYQAGNYRLAREIGRKLDADFVYLHDMRFDLDLKIPMCRITRRLIDVFDSTGYFQTDALISRKRMSQADRRKANRKAQKKLFGDSASVAIARALLRREGGLQEAMAGKNLSDKIGDRSLSQRYAKNPDSDLSGKNLVPLNETFVVQRTSVVREKPEERAPRVGLLYRNDEVTASGRTRDGKWIYFNLARKFRGYVHEASLVPSTRFSLRRYGKKFAVVVGISDYKYMKPAEETAQDGSLPDLKYAHRDAQEFEAFLKDSSISGEGWEIKTFLDEKATQRNIMKTLTRTLARAEPQDLVYFFFSGHGRSPTDAPREVYLLTYESDPSYEFSGLSYPQIRRLISNSPAKHVIAFIDACRSGVVGFGKGGATQTLFDQDVLGEQWARISGNKVIFTSGRSTQASWEDPRYRLGVFTHFLLKGLRGGARDDLNKGFVDLGELYDYVKDNVYQYTRRNARMAPQDPRLWSKSGLTRENFPLAMRR